jgi:hypothetical protein
MAPQLNCPTAHQRCDRRHGSRLQAEAVPGASRDGRRRAHAGHNQRIPRRLPASDRNRQQGSERQLIPWREPPWRLRPRACRRSRERQGRDSYAAIRLKRRVVEVDRCAREGAWDRAPVSRSTAKRGRPAVQKAGLQTKKAQAAKLETRKRQAGAGNDPSMRAKQAKSSKVSSLEEPDKSIQR